MFEAIVWGVVQGITEFLPISSDGHLVLVPALFGLSQPDLATTAVLHLGTLAAVITYFRRDLWELRRARTDPNARRLLLLLLLGTLPAVVAVFFVDQVEELQRSTTITAIFLMVTGVVLLIANRFPKGERTIEEAKPADALSIGVAQLLAVLPGISRSGFTIATALGRRFDKIEAARFSFLLGIPAVTGAGVLELRELLGRGGVPTSAWVGVAVAAVVGYLAIAFLLRMLERSGLAGYGIYCLLFGVIALIAI